MSELSDFQRGNLEKLARYLWDLPQSVFSMHEYIQGDICEDSARRHCGTVGCAVGHGPNAGIKARPGETWHTYANRVFLPLVYGTPSDAHSWCFCGGWSRSDNTPRGAAKRILYLLRHGVPSDWFEQVFNSELHCYHDEVLDAVSLPARQPLTGVVELVKAAV